MYNDPNYLNSLPYQAAANSQLLQNQNYMQTTSVSQPIWGTASSPNLGNLYAPETKSKSLMKTIIEDAKAFIHEHKSVIYTIILVLLVDHFFLNGRLKAKIQEVAHRFLNEAEKKISPTPATEVTVTPAAT